MTSAPDLAVLERLFKSDQELRYKLVGLASVVVRFDLGDDGFDVLIAGGEVAGLRASHGLADVTFAASPDFWRGAMGNPPMPGYESLVAGGQKGLTLTGDVASLISPYHPAWERIYQLFGIARRGPVRRKAAEPEPFRSTDTAVGRYRYVAIDGVETRIYYETAGDGPTPLLLQHTAGADGRQWRHLLADPDLQQDFTMIAYDLPYHGRSLPPIAVRWWEQPYRLTRETLMNSVVAISAAIGLDRPIFMGCSVGGQLALDLAAFHPELFKAFIAVNGWHDMEPLAKFSNAPFRDPSISQNWSASLCHGATSPEAPEANSHETYWIYRSNFPGIYAGDNDYFVFGHDLRRDGHLIDGRRSKVYVLTGSYDPSMLFAEHGGAAVARNIPGVTFREMPGLGHFAPSDDPLGFRAEIIPVLREIQAAAD